MYVKAVNAVLFSVIYTPYEGIIASFYEDGLFNSCKVYVFFVEQVTYLQCTLFDRLMCKAASTSCSNVCSAGIFNWYGA